MTTETPSCPLPHQPVLFDTPHKLAPEMQREEIARSVGLDLKGCNVCSIVTALNEFDHKRISHLSHRIETWPDDVRVIMEREVKAFAERNGGARIEAITTAIGGAPKSFLLMLHWRAK
jgi:hypothetical protein